MKILIYLGVIVVSVITVKHNMKSFKQHVENIKVNSAIIKQQKAELKRKAESNARLLKEITDWKAEVNQALSELR